MPNDMPEIMTVKQLCDYLQTSRPIVDNYIKNDQLPFHTLTDSLTSQKRFKKSLVDRWVENRSEVVGR